jgi:magnesium transporter
MSLIRALLYDPSAKELLQGDATLIDAWQAQAQAWIWLDLDACDPGEELRLLVERFGIHPLAIQDAQRDRHPPKFEVFPENVFVLLKGLSADTVDIRYRTLQIACFVGERFLVTRRAARSVSIDNAWKETTDGKLALSAAPAQILFRITRLITDRYTGIVLALESRLDQLEDEMLERPSDKLLAELTEYNSHIKKLRRVLDYQKAVFARLSQGQSSPALAAAQHEFNDVYENTERLASLAALLQELVNDLIQGYISITSHRMNQIMKVLTVVTVVFKPLGLMAGLYGMNIEHKPQLHWRHGYLLFLGNMAAVAGTLLWMFRRLKWL